ncbi:MAG: histidine kinase dimerization/phosphoacceptor domain -containing protein [Methanobacteriaceae archaeon]|nr:histidine kinase dimerization/phosphoacceptor domain -containing protein [Methanobacteriaceae archaeon]
MGVISVFYTSLHEEMITIIYVLFFFIFGSILSINNSLDLGLFKYFNKKYVDSLRTLFIDILFITSIAVVLMHMVKTYSFSINNAILLFCGFVIAIILISIILIMYDNRKINETKIDTLEEEQIVTSNYYEIILSKLGDNIAYIDKNDKVIYHNNSMYNLIGINRKGEYLHSENDFKLPIYDEYQKAKETLQDVELNFWHVVPKDGKNIYLNGTCSPVILDNKFDGCVISLYDLTTQKEDESSMKKLIDQKNSLLSEIHHRVKNNLQIINSLLSLQSHNTKDEVIKEALTDAQVRVKSMALVHEFFYQSTDFKYLDFKAYLSKLLSEIQYAYDTGEIEFKLNVKNCDDDSDIIGIDMETAIPIGLIINEAVTNSIKYAFLNKKGEISVKFSKQEFEYNLLISDNGVGLNKDYISGFGINLINSLVIQLEGNINIENKNGCTIDITYNN